jgi:hypothetical protein
LISDEVNHQQPRLALGRTQPTPQLLQENHSRLRRTKQDHPIDIRDIQQARQFELENEFAFS